MALGLLGRDLLQSVFPLLGLPINRSNPIGFLSSGCKLLPCIFLANVAVNSRRVSICLVSLLAGAAGRAPIVRFAFRSAANDTW